MKQLYGIGFSRLQDFYRNKLHFLLHQLSSTLYNDKQQVGKKQAGTYLPIHIPLYLLFRFCTQKIFTVSRCVSVCRIVCSQALELFFSTQYENRSREQWKSLSINYLPKQIQVCRHKRWLGYTQECEVQANVRMPIRT